MLVELICSGLGVAAGGYAGWRFGIGEYHRCQSGYQRGYDRGRGDAQLAMEPERQATRKLTNLELDRLRHHLAAYDECECGAQRREHHDWLPVRCPRFRLKTPADPLETVVASHDGSGSIDYETLTVRRAREIVNATAEPDHQLSE